MTDSIILKYLSREYTHNNPSIYLYVVGGIKNRATTLGKVFKDVELLFVPPFSERVVKETIKYFAEMKTELEKLVKDPFERKALDYFEFIDWADSKIQNEPFIEIIKAGEKQS